LSFAFAEDEKTISLEIIVDVVKEKKLSGTMSVPSHTGKIFDKIRVAILEKDGVDLEKI
jgi:putative methionine-R-sulfoxide reductase with GAF domain